MRSSPLPMFHSRPAILFCRWTHGLLARQLWALGDRWNTKTWVQLMEFLDAKFDASFLVDSWNGWLQVDYVHWLQDSWYLQTTCHNGACQSPNTSTDCSVSSHLPALQCRTRTQWLGTLNATPERLWQVQETENIWELWPLPNQTKQQKTTSKKKTSKNTDWFFELNFKICTGMVWLRKLQSICSNFHKSFRDHYTA